VSKNIKTRIQNKHDIEANWSTSTLVPLVGELIIYDKDATHDYVRFKVGDGETLAARLPFATDAGTIIGDSYPTTSTIGHIGQCYIYQGSGAEAKIYICSAIAFESGINSYYWDELVTASDVQNQIDPIKEAIGEDDFEGTLFDRIATLESRTQVQADLSETDETSAAFVKNKTHGYWDGLGIDRIDTFSVGWTKWQDMSDATSTILNHIAYDTQIAADTGILVLKFGANAFGTTQTKEVWLKDVAGIRYEKIDNVNSRYKINGSVYVYFITDLTALTEEFKDIFDTVGLYINITSEAGVSGIAFAELYLYNITSLRKEFLPADTLYATNVATDDEILELLTQEDMFPVVTDADGSVLADENENI
jgi:hypothetical protein